MKAVLINSNLDSGFSPVIKRVWPPLDLANCASILKKNGFDTKIIDTALFNLNFEEVVAELDNSDIVVVNTASLDRWQCPFLEINYFYKLTKKIKERFPGVIVIVIGPHSFFNPNGLLKYSDIVIVGGPEPKIKNLFPGKIDIFLKTEGIVYKKNAKIVENKGGVPFSFDEFGKPSFELLPFKDYSYFIFGKPIMLVETSRGCSGNCNFCFKSMYGVGVKFKSIGNVIQELKYLRNKLGIKNIVFIDTDFVSNKKRIINLCNEFIKNKLDINWTCDVRLNSIDDEILSLMKRSGCSLIHFGIESGSKGTYSKLNKLGDFDKIGKKLILTKKNGIRTLGYFRFGHINETKQDMLATMKFAKSLPIDFASFGIVVPYPGTRIQVEGKHYFKHISSEGIPLAYERHVSLSELKDLVKKAYIRFYLRPSYILTHLGFIFKFNLLKGGFKILISSLKN